MSSIHEPIVIGLDFDDVLMEFNGALCLFHNAQYGTSLTRADITSHHLKETWGCTQEEVIRRVNEFYRSLEHDLASPVVGAVEVLPFP